MMKAILKHLSNTSAFYLQASMLVSFLAGSSAPKQLNSFSAAQYGSPPAMPTLIYAVYAFSAIVALFAFGSLSDYVGRRPVLAVAALLQVIVMWLFARLEASDLVDGVVVTRIVQGIASGGAASAIGAGLLDIDRTKGTFASAVAPLLGIALASLTWSLSEFQVLPARLACAIFGVIFMIQAIGVLLMPETLMSRAGMFAWLKPGFRFSRELRRPLLSVTPAQLSCWAVVGYFCSFAPEWAQFHALMSASPPVSSGWVFHADFHAPPPSQGLGALALCAFALSALAAVFLTRARSPRFVTRLGLVGQVMGIALTLPASGIDSPPMFFLACVIAGGGVGAVFQAALRSVLPLASPPERAGVSSVLCLVACLAAALPPVLAALPLYSQVKWTQYLACVVLLAVFALVVSLRERAPRLA